MELRVWTEGIQRVVCGVTDVTTCRDVIVALARTVGKTGRYSLVETCHGQQRRIPACERLNTRLSDLAGCARLSLVYGSAGSCHDTRRRRRINGCFTGNRHMAPLNKSRSVGCCRSLVAASQPTKDELRSDKAHVTDGVAPRYHQPVQHVAADRSAAESAENGSTLSLYELQTVSRKQLIDILSRKQEDISHRETELADISSELSVTEEMLRSLRDTEQSLSGKLSELEALERRIDEELEELELVSWADKLTMETTRCTQLQADADAAMTGTARSDIEVDHWQQRVDEIIVETETIKSNSQRAEADKIRLKEQFDNLEAKLAETRCQNNDCRSALQQIEKTIESDAALVEKTLEERLRLQQQLETSRNTASQFQRSHSFDSDARAKSKVRTRSPRVTVPDHSHTVNIAFSCQI